MKWNKYTIETTTAAEDYLSSALMDLGIEGVQIEDNVPLTKEDQAEMFIDFLPELPPDEGISYVSFYLEDNGQDDTELLKQVKTTIEEMRNVVDMGTGKITSDQTEDLDWINNWKKFFSSFYIDDILIKPTWEELKEEDRDKFLIEIDPGVSFGTGKHETTQLCIRQLLKYIRGNETYTPQVKTPKVLDVGCGSGILSIVALKLGASEVVGTDLDPDCMTSTHDNMEVNHLDQKLGTFYVGNLIDDTELQEKVNLYRTALENATLQSEEYERIQNKLIATEKQLNQAIKSRDINDTPLPSKDNKNPLQNKKLEAEQKLATAISQIRKKLYLENLTESEKEILQTQQQYNELIALCQQFGIDTIEVYNAYSEKIEAIIDRELENEVSASIAAQDRINQALMSSSEREKASVRQKYAELIALAEQYGIDTLALKEKMDEELASIKEDEEPQDIFGMSPEDWEDLEGKIGKAIQLAGQLADIWGQFNQIQADKEKKELQEYERSCNRKKELLNKQLNAGKISQEQYNARTSQLDADLEKKKTEIAKKQAKRDKAQSIFSAIISTAAAIAQALPNIPLSIIAGIMGAAQIAVIASQPLPEYAKGGLTDGAKMYIAGEAGQEWISPNWMLKDKTTGPIIQQLEMVRSGILSPEQLAPIRPDFQTMSAIPMYASGGFTSTGSMETNYYTTTTTTNQDNDTLMNINENIKILIEYLSDPRNRQAVISNDLLQKHNEEINMINRLKRL